jgi:hypothetical protein
MAEVIELASRRRAAEQISLDAVADELGLDGPMLWAWLAVEAVMRERQGQPARDPREDAERLLLNLCSEAEVVAAMHRIDERKRARAG